MRRANANPAVGDGGARQDFKSKTSPANTEIANSTQVALAEAAFGTDLAIYDRACAALAEAASVDEVKHILDVAVAMKAYARQAKNHTLEADAVALRMRATRGLDEMRRAQAATVGLNQGAVPGKAGSKGDPVLDSRPTLASQGIDKHLAHQGRVLGKLSESDFERKVDEARASVGRVVRRVVHEVEIEQQREVHRSRTAQGGSVADLVALAASGFRAGLIAPDPPWPFRVYTEQGRQRSPERHYDTMTLDEIKALPIAALAADNCALLLWSVWPELPGVLEVISAWGFTYKTAGFVWVKLNANGEGLFTGMGFHTRANTEFALLATRGNPLRLAADVHQVIMAPVGAHSEKPAEVYTRMERLYGGPRLELFARKPRSGWITWGDELPPPAQPGTPQQIVPAAAVDDIGPGSAGERARLQARDAELEREKRRLELRKDAPPPSAPPIAPAHDGFGIPPFLRRTSIGGELREGRAAP